MSLEPYAALVNDHFPNAQLQAMTRLTGGVSADVYRLDLKPIDSHPAHLVLRVHGASHAGHSAELEYRLLAALYRSGLPVPEPLVFDPSGTLLPDPFLVMSFIEGSSTVPAEREDQYIDRMADALAKIHELPIASLPRLPERNDPLPEVFDFFPRGSRWDGLHSHLRSMTETSYRDPPKLLHGDFWPENLLWKNDSIAGVLDWEDAALGDPMSDVAACRVELRYKFGRASMQRFTQAYAKQRAVDPTSLALWQIYVAAAADHFMGEWNLDQELEAHMHTEALASVEEAGEALMTETVDSLLED